MKSFVCVKHGYEPWEMAYDAAKAVLQDDVRGKRVLLKPNLGRVAPANSGVCTGPEVVRGVIRFFKEQEAGEILVGDGAIWGYNFWDALERSGIGEVCRQEGVTPVNLDEAEPVVKEIPGGLMVQSLKFSSLPFQVDMTVSIPVMKTHIHAGSTLGIKNMKGCLYKMEKTRLHRINKPSPDLARGKCLDWGIADMATILLPDYTIVDGTTCMEGFGPSIGDPIQLDLVLAGKDPTAVDYTAMTLMGLEPEVAKYLHLVQARCGTAAMDEITVEPADYRKWAKPFRKADSVSFQNEYPNITLIERGSCSACSATCMQFIKKQGPLFPKDFHFKICAGRDLSEEDMAGENVYLVGNCTAAHANGRPYCKGCPPVGSSILAFIRGETIE